MQNITYKLDKQLMQDYTTTQELFGYLQATFFAGTDVMKTVLGFKNEAESNDFMLANIERLLAEPYNSEKKANDNKAHQFARLFFSSKEGRIPAREYNPCLDPAVRLEMNDDEKELCAFYLTMAGLCHDLTDYYMFSLDQLKPGLETGEDWIYDFQITNKHLVLFLETTTYRNIAARILHIVVKENLNLVLGTNDTLQEYLAHGEGPAFMDLRAGKLSADSYIDKVLALLNDWLAHDLEAERLNLNDNELAIHDQLMGIIRPGDFIEEYVEASRTLATYFNRPPKIGTSKKLYVSAFIGIVEAYVEESEIDYDENIRQALANYAEYVYELSFD